MPHREVENQTLIAILGPNGMSPAYSKYVELFYAKSTLVELIQTAEISRAKNGEVSDPLFEVLSRLKASGKLKEEYFYLLEPLDPEQIRKDDDDDNQD